MLLWLSPHGDVGVLAYTAPDSKIVATKFDGRGRVWGWSSSVALVVSLLPRSHRSKTKCLIGLFGSNGILRQPQWKTCV